METEKMTDYEYSELLISCKSEEEFKKLWNPDKFKWASFPYSLVKHNIQYFHIWWDAEKYPYYKNSALLCQYCSEYFKTWWNPEKFNWDVVIFLQKYCQDYKYIWDMDYVKWKLKNT